MSLRLRSRSFVERELPIGRAARRDLLRDAHRDFVGHPNRIYLLWLLSLPAGGMAMLAAFILGARTWWVLVGAAATGIASASLAVIILLNHFFAPIVYRHVRRRGYDVCVACGYWLRGLGPDVEVCPECGTRREPPARARLG